MTRVPSADLAGVSWDLAVRIHPSSYVVEEDHRGRAWAFRMTDDAREHLADAVEAGEFDIQLAQEQSEAELRRFLAQVEAGEFEPDPGLEATVRIVRSLLDDEPDADGEE